jgi:hypothetical protein
MQCPDGEIGRRTSFRCWRSKGCGGSSPLLGTIFFYKTLSMKGNTEAELPTITINASFLI